MIKSGLVPPYTSSTIAGISASPGAVLFEFDSDQLRPEAEPQLRELLRVLDEHPELGGIEVQGHTDNVGSSSYNLDLSTRRAEAVRACLVQQGLEADRIQAKVYGEGAPVEPNDTAGGRAANRRVEFVVTTAAP